MPGIVSPGLINLRDERFLNASWLQADWWEIKTAFTAVTLTDGKREGGKANGAVGGVRCSRGRWRIARVKGRCMRVVWKGQRWLLPRALTIHTLCCVYVKNCLGFLGGKSVPISPFLLSNFTILPQKKYLTKNKKEKFEKPLEIVNRRL